MVCQLPLFPVLDDAGSRPPRPDLDAATIRLLKGIGITYLGTHWSAYWQEWQHEIEDGTPRLKHRARKTDEGIAALLRRGKEA